MESKLYPEDDHNLNMREDGGGAIEVLDTETTRVDVNSPQVRACTDMNATAKAIMSGAPSASGPMSDQDLVTFMWDKFHQIQEEARQQHLQILEQYRQMQEQSLQWMQQQQRHIHEQAMSMSEDTQHLPEQSGSGEIWLNEQLIQVAPSHEGRPQEAPRIARQLHEVPQKEERPEEAPQVRGQQQQDPQAKIWPVEAPPEEG